MRTSNFSNPRLEAGQEITCEIESAAFEGKSIARVEGFVLFVDGAVPGDVAVVRITRVKKKHAEAALVSVVTPSASRVEPPCQHFGVCGGCRWQHVAYEEQLRFKTRHVRDCFERLGGFRDVEVLPIVGCDEPYWYRNKMEFSFAAHEWTKQKPTGEAEAEGVFLGLHAPQRFDKVIDVRACYLESEESNKVLATTRNFARRSGLPVYDSHADSGFWRFLVIRQSKRSGEVLVNIVTREDRPEVMREFARDVVADVPAVSTIVNTINTTRSQVASGASEKVYGGSGRIEMKIGRFSFEVSAQSFFQTNTEQTERLYEAAIRMGTVEKSDVVYDLYAGIGTISLLLSDVAQEVVAIEAFEGAVADARRNAERNGVSNCRFVHGDMKSALKQMGVGAAAAGPRIVMVDPPRSGMHENAVRDIVQLKPERVVYISCNPATQARDCKLFAERGYSLGPLQPVDMFPQTYHVENIAVLERTTDPPGVSLPR